MEPGAGHERAAPRQDAEYKEEFEKQEGKRQGGSSLCSEPFALNGKLVSEVEMRNSAVPILHAIIIEDKSLKTLEEGKNVAQEEEQKGPCGTGQDPELLAPQPSALGSRQLNFTAVGRHLPTHFSEMNTDPPVPEQNQEYTVQPNPQGQADQEAARKQSVLAAGSQKASTLAVGAQPQPEQSQEANQDLSLGHGTRRSAKCATVPCIGLQSHRLSSLPVSKGQPDSTKEKASSPDAPEEPAPPARKKTRTFYSAEQLDQLERMFQEDHYPDNEKRREIAATVGVTPQRVMVWFQNRRAKWRKTEKLTVKESRKAFAAASTLSIISQQSSQGAVILPGPQLSDPVHVPPATLRMSTAAVNCSSLLSGQSASLVSTAELFFLRSRPVSAEPSPIERPINKSSNFAEYSVASVAAKTTSYESGQAKAISESTFASLKEEIFPGIPSPPPIRRASLPLNMLMNQNNPMVPLMLDTPSSEYSPANQESNASEPFTYSTQSQSVPTPVQCSYSEQLEPTANLETPYYPPVTQPGAYPFNQYPQHQMSQLHPFPIHLTGSVLPSVHLTPVTPNKSHTTFVSLPGNGRLVTYGTAEAAQGYLENPIEGQILIQPPAGSSGYIPAFQALPWSEIYVQGAAAPTQLCAPVPLSSSGGAEQPQYVHSQNVQPSSCLLQLPKTALPGSALLFTAKQMLSAAPDSSPDHPSQAEPMATCGGASDPEHILREDENMDDFSEDSKN